jgi:uncharacterized protein (TIGR00369 family)
MTNDNEANLGELLETPHARAIGLRLEATPDGRPLVRLPYDYHLIGDPDSGVLHGGVITAMLDQMAGLLARPPGIDRDDYALATLDLRIDYMGPATPGEDLLATGECYKRTSNIAFVRAEAFQASSSEPVASCVATFMLDTRNAPADGGPSSKADG